MGYHYVRAARLRTFPPMLRDRTLLGAYHHRRRSHQALSEIGVNAAPTCRRGAGIVGVAIGFGSQKLVQDVITGLFLLLENMVQVGRYRHGVRARPERSRTCRSAPSACVPATARRISCPFSAVTSITNSSRGVGNAAVSVNGRLRCAIPTMPATCSRRSRREMRNEPAFRNLIRSDLQLLGVDKVDGAMATIVGQIPCTDGGRWPVQREFNRRMKRRFQEAGIEIASPSQTIVVQVPGIAAENDVADRTR